MEVAYLKIINGYHGCLLLLRLYLTIPERVRVNYEDVVEEIRRVSAGKDGTTLEERADPDGQPVTGGMFRFTSNPRRSHDPY